MSKRTEAVGQLRGLSDAELTQHLHERRRKLFEVRFQQVTGQVENQRQIRALRREVARALTVRNQPVADAEPEQAADAEGEER